MFETNKIVQPTPRLEKTVKPEVVNNQQTPSKLDHIGEIGFPSRNPTLPNLSDSSSSIAVPPFIALCHSSLFEICPISLDLVRSLPNSTIDESGGWFN